MKVLNYKLKKAGYDTPIKAGTGASWGRALMIKAGLSGSGINDVVYMGDVVNLTTPQNSPPRATTAGVFVLSSSRTTSSETSAAKTRRPSVTRTGRTTATPLTS